MDDWDRIQQLFGTAADLPAREQERYLDSACRGDAGLRTVLEELLAADRDDLESVAAEAVEDEASLLLGSSMLAGNRVGVYKIVKEIGRGGMGAVFLATRDDDQFHKNVAIKIVKLGMDTAEVLSRFRYERQILANLDHPYIARLLDGGTTPEGRPFLVMDYVEGQPVDRFCREQALTVKERCRLFLRITEAVSYAHRNLVVHRDLKPANIFVTADGSPKLLDFGVAKLLGPEADSGATLTRVPRALTPEYASPEQVCGKPVSTATDIYSLGAVLYELLTDRRAHAPEDGAPAEAREIVPPKTVRPDLDNDLDNIVRMAMRHEPERRYPSVDEFADDLRRYLDGWPVRARQDSFLYRARKFIQRRRFTLTAASLIVLTAVAGMVAVFLKGQEAEAARRAAVVHQHAAEAEHARAERERDMAVKQSQRAESESARARERLTQLLDLSNRSLADIAEMERRPATVATRQQFTQRTLAFLEQLSREAGTDERLLTVLGTAYYRLGDSQSDFQSVNPGGISAALDRFRKGASLIEPLRDRATSPELPQLWLRFQQGIGHLLIEQGHWPEARTIIVSARDTAARLARAWPGAKDLLRLHASLGSLLSGTFEAASDFAHSLPVTRQVLEELTALDRRFPQDPELQTDLSAAHVRYAYDMHSLGDSETAAVEHRKAVEIREQIVREHPNDVSYRRNLMLGYEHLAALLGDELRGIPGILEAAREYVRKAGALAEAALVDSPNHPTQFDYAGHLIVAANLGVAPEGETDPLVGLQKAAGLMESLAKAAPVVVKYRRVLMDAYLAMGARLLAKRDAAGAQAEYQKAETQGKWVLSTLPGDRYALAQTLQAQRGIAQALGAAGDRDGALEAGARLVASAQAGLAFPTDGDLRQSYVAEAHLTLGSLHQRFKNWPDARGEAQSAIAVLRPLVEGHGQTSYQKLLSDAETLLRSATRAGESPAPQR